MMKTSQAQIKFKKLCLKFYPSEFKNNFDSNLNDQIIDQLYPLLKEIEIEEIADWIKTSTSFIFQLINRSYTSSVFCRQPSILLIYFLIETQKYLLYINWPWPEDELNRLFSDIGEAPIGLGR